jgi:hypothetical protein
VAVMGMSKVGQRVPLYKLQVRISRIVLGLRVRIHRVSLGAYKAEAFALVGLNCGSLDPLY